MSVEFERVVKVVCFAVSRRRMGKHETGYARVERDLYPTPNWVVSALAEHVDLRGLTVWEPACGDGRMAEALRLQGCARVYTSDIVDRGTGQDEVLDFLSAHMPKLARFDMSATNPPFGQGGRQATAFIEVGLRRLPVGATLALLLPCDFDSAKTRALFRRLLGIRRQDRAAGAHRLVPAQRWNPRGA